jgi:N-acetylmuramoyl-L-alanine amidase
MLMTGCLGNKEYYSRFSPGSVKETIVFLEIADPENRMEKNQLAKLNAFLGSLLGKGKKAKVISLNSGPFTGDHEGCTSFIDEEVLYEIMEKHGAGRIFFGDVLVAGQMSAVLFLNSLSTSPDGLVSDRRQILLNRNTYGNWETGSVARDERLQDTRTIMLDPGHGGVDTGAEARFDGKKLYEKELNNNLTALLAQELITRGYRIVYTREPDNDLFLNPQSRAEIINNANPDFLISIHHDFSERREDSGFAVYYSSFKPVLESRDAYILVDGEKREYLSQYPQRGGMVINFINEYGRESNTRELPWWSGYDPFIHDDTPTPASTDSLKLAYLIYSELRLQSFLKPYHYMEGRIIEDRDYAVLRETRVPSILIESAFITNKGDMQYMTDSQNKLCFIESIANSVDVYFEGNNN